MILVDRNSLLDRKPDRWFHPKPNNKGIPFWRVNRGVIDEGPFEHIKYPEPSGKLGHVTEKLIARFYPASDAKVALPET